MHLASFRHLIEFRSMISLPRRLVKPVTYPFFSVEGPSPLHHTLYPPASLPSYWNAKYASAFIPASKLRSSTNHSRHELLTLAALYLRTLSLGLGFMSFIDSCVQSGGHIRIRPRLDCNKLTRQLLANSLQNKKLSCRREAVRLRLSLKP